MKEENKELRMGKTSLLAVGGATLLVIAGAFALYRLNGSKQGTPTPDMTVAAGFATTQNAAEAPRASAALKPARTPPAGYTEYRNEQYRFALFYPSGLTVKTYDEGGGASTIVFQNTDTAQGFQIFIVPYGAAQVSEAQFKRDEPSGVMQEPQNVTVDGVFGTMFFGEVPLLGATREIWFIHRLPGQGGYLFEVSTPKPLDSWLQGIIGSFQFI